MNLGRQFARTAQAVVLALVIASSAHAFEDGEPVLMRALYTWHFDQLGDMTAWTDSAIAAAIYELDPASCYIPVHSGYWEREIRALENEGFEVLRYLNATTALPAALGTSRPAFERMMAELAEEYPLQDGAGNELRYRWFGNPRIISWDRVPIERIDELVAFYTWLEADLFEFDIVFQRLATWMLEDFDTVTPADLETFYDRSAYQANLLRFVDAFMLNRKGPSSRASFFNGPHDEFWRSQGRDVMFEDASRRGVWEDDFTTWQECPGCVLELREPNATDDATTVWSKNLEALEHWKKKGGLLWIENGKTSTTRLQQAAVRLRERWEKKQ